MKLPDFVTIREVALRDGLQSLNFFVPTKDKLKIIDGLIHAGIKEIETTSFVSPKAVFQLKDAAELMERVPRSNIIHAALVPNLIGVKKAVTADINELVVVISATESHNMRNINQSIKDSLAGLEGIFKIADQNSIPIIGSIAVAFGCPYQGDVPFEDVNKIIRKFISYGVKSIILADTTGMATPVRIEGLMKRVLDQYPQIEFILHLHNNRGTAMANLFAALILGIKKFDTALGGIGGCPFVPQASGNLPTEDVVFMLEDMGIRTGIDLVKIIHASKLFEKLLGFVLPGQVMKSGPRITGMAEKICHSSTDDSTFPISGQKA